MVLPQIITTFMLVLIPVTLVKPGRHRRMPFDFSMNKPGVTVDWNNAVMAPLLMDQPTTPGVPVPDKGGDNNSPETPLSNPQTNPATTKDKPQFRMDCSVNLCFIPNMCPPSQICQMNMECSDTVCVDVPPTTSTPAVLHTSPSSPSHGMDCPTDRCLSISDPCPSTQVCRMNLDCSDSICIDSSSVNEAIGTTTSKPKFRADCPNDLCLFWPEQCPSNQDCRMSWDCVYSVCVNKLESDSVDVGNELEPNSTHTAAGTEIENTTSSFNTNRSRECPGELYFTCVHGYCGSDNFSCDCEEGWVGKKCDLPCYLHCKHGNCIINRFGELYIKPEDITEKNMQCNCQLGWTNPLCSVKVLDPVVEERKKTVRLGLGFGSALLFVVGISIIALLVMWRKRVIIVMKLVYFFKLKEDDDGRLFDAYISMGSSNRGMDFVQYKLCPVLQDLGFKHFVQARDQLIGEAMTDSILKAMENSRRTILIITPEYIQNEWSTFECFIAQIETLRLHQRIIPIVLEDISADKQKMNKTLKHIVESVKCLKFPQVKAKPNTSIKEMEAWKMKKEGEFWKRLELTMPKKRKTSEWNDTEFSSLDIKNVKPLGISFIESTKPAIQDCSEASNSHQNLNERSINIEFADMYSGV